MVCAVLSVRLIITRRRLSSRIMSKTSMPLETYSLGTLTSESSRSASSKSHQSEQEKEIDFTKDNSTSPIDLECYIQAERITKILDEAIHKTKLALCLPNLVQEYRTLSSMLSDQHMDDLLYIFEQYENPLFSSSLLNVAALEDIKNGDVSLRNRLNPEIGHLMYIVGSYPDLKPKIDEIVKEMKCDYDTVNPSQDDRTHSGIEYLLTLERFRNLMVRQMTTTAAEDLSAKISIKKLQASNDSYIEKIKYYSKLLKEENATFESNIKQKKDIIYKLEQELASLSHDASVKLKQKILDSDRQMVLASRSHTIKNDMLIEEEAECRQVYDNLLRNHMMDEKNQRLRRFKVETQLLSWLQKYDLEMGDKQQELDEFTEKYEDELRKCEELEAKIAEQDIEYLPLMEEREAEYQQEMTEKMNKFKVEHAARVIQFAWRDVLANRAEKKRLLKLKKKLLEEQKKALREKAKENRKKKK